MQRHLAILRHGIECAEVAIGSEDRLIAFSDGVWGFQLRGSAEIYFPNPTDTESGHAANAREAAKIAYHHCNFSSLA